MLFNPLAILFCNYRSQDHFNNGYLSIITVLFFGLANLAMFANLFGADP